MKAKMMCVIALAGVLGGSVGQLLAQARPSMLRLDASRLELHNVKAEPTTYHGRTAIRIADANPFLGGEGRLAIVRGSAFRNGTIEVDVSGDTAPNSPAWMRGFVGVAFRVSADGSHFECFYLRPKNGRSEDQVQRNHSVQYISIPGFGWQRLRTEHPGEYESYADLVPGQWTHVKIWVEGSRARLYVNSAKQPVLVVNDLKQPVATGSVALWVGPGTIAYFSKLRVTR
ncbi:MAG: hypothetical protein P8Z30_10650 [Acidobacteriota bacterium]